MACFSGPRISNDSLVLHLDAANLKSLNIPTQADHGYADWYCFVSGSATYSIVNTTGGVIYENNAGVITSLVTATTPQRGTITVTAGRTYYGSVPINLVVEDQQHSIAPLTMMGTQFWNIATRSNPTTYYVYSPYGIANITFYDNTTGGLTGTPTSVISLSAGQSGTFTSNNLTNHWISSSAPILASATQTSADKTILSPMANYVYQRYSAYSNTTNGTTTTSNLTNVVYDSTYKVMAMTVADGAGSDCAQALGLEYLSDTYSFGNVLSDYAIAAPYDSTIVTTYYWSANSSGWVAWDSHTLSGTITSPAYVQRDGTAGPGVTATNINGSATNMASGATLWKWEGNKPFYLCINDISDDEFSVLGWSQARTTSPRSGTTWADTSGNGRDFTLTSMYLYDASNNGSIDFNRNMPPDVKTGGWAEIISASGTLTANNYLYSDHTTEVWAKISNFSPTNADGTEGSSALIVYKGYHAGFYYNASTISYFVWDGNSGGTTVSKTFSSLGISQNQWFQIVMSRSGSSFNLYVNGVYSANTTGTPSPWGVTTNNLRIASGNTPSGVYSFLADCNVSSVRMYNKALTALEIEKNFQASRGRYGI